MLYPLRHRTTSAVSCTEMAVPVKMQFGTLSRVGPGNHVLDGGAQWRHLANMTEPSVCGSDAALCQITLTTCSTDCQTAKVKSKSMFHTLY